MALCSQRLAVGVAASSLAIRPDFGFAQVQQGSGNLYPHHLGSHNNGCRYLCTRRGYKRILFREDLGTTSDDDLKPADRGGIRSYRLGRGGLVFA
jgi:hypothetical protein